MLCKLLRQVFLIIDFHFVCASKVKQNELPMCILGKVDLAEVVCLPGYSFLSSSSQFIQASCFSCLQTECCYHERQVKGRTG